MKNITTKTTILSLSLIFLAAGCHRAPKVPQVTTYNGSTMTVKETIVENTNKISASFTVPTGQTAEFMLRSFRPTQVKTSSSSPDTITAIDGITPDSKHVWAFYVNGQLSSVAPGDYKPKDGDSLMWQMDPVK